MNSAEYKAIWGSSKMASEWMSLALPATAVILALTGSAKGERTPPMGRLAQPLAIA